MGSAMLRLTSCIVACALGLTIGLAPAAGQTAPAAATASADQADKAAGNPDIVVRARRQVERKQALKFVRQASAPIGGQLARFNGDVCPAAVGFSDAIAAVIVERMRAVATAAGVSVAKPGCGANIVLIATEDGSALIRDFERRQMALVAGVPPIDLRAQIASHGPVRGWVTTAVENEYGDKPYVPPGLDPPVLQVYSASIMNPPTQQAIQVSVLVVDMPALVGKSTTQIADYAAMRTLARTRPVAGNGPVGSILSLFDTKATPPAAMSEADLAYLHTLYRLAGNRTDRFQIEEISKTVKKASQGK